MKRDTFNRVSRFLLGLASILLGQYVMLQQEPLVARFVFAPTLNELFRIDVPNLDNVIVATVMLIGGGAILASVFSDRAFPANVPDAMPISRVPLPTSTPRVRRGMVGLVIAALLLFMFLMWRLSAKDDANWLAIVLTAALCLMWYVAYLFDRHAGTHLSPDLEWHDVALVVAFVLLGIGIGAFDLSQKPFSLMGDEGSFWETAKAIATGEYRPSVFDLGVYTYPILGSFYQASILKLFGLSLWSWRFASVLAGAAAIAPTYLLAREMFDRRVALLASAVMIVTPYMLAFERLGYNNSQSLFPVALALYLLYAGLQRNSALYVILGGCAAGLGFYTYTGAELGVVCALLLFVYLFLWGRNGTRSALIVLGILFMVGWGMTALPRYAYDIASHPDLVSYKSTESLFPNVFYAQVFFKPAELYRDFPPIQIGDITFFYRPDLYARLLVRGIIRTFLAFHDDHVVTEHFIDSPLPGPFAVVFYFLGLVFALANFRRSSHALLVVWFAGGLILLSGISTFPPRHQHLVAIIPAISTFVALGMTATADFVSACLPIWRTILSAALVAVCFGVIALTGLHDYFFQVQAAYPPSFDQVMTFTAFNLQSPHEIVYVFDKPEEKGYVPYGILQIPTLATFQTVSRQELADNQVVPEAGISYIFFFHASDQTTVVEYLTRTLVRPINLIVYRISDPHDTALSVAFDR